MRSPSSGCQSRFTCALEHLAEVALERLEFLVRAPVRHQRDRVARGADQAARRVERLGDRHRPALQHRLVGARALEDPREVAALVADPRAVHGRVLERRDARDAVVLPLVERLEEPLGLAVPDLDRAAALAARAHRRRRPSGTRRATCTGTAATAARRPGRCRRCCRSTGPRSAAGPRPGGCSRRRRGARRRAPSTSTPRA